MAAGRRRSRDSSSSMENGNTSSWRAASWELLAGDMVSEWSGDECVLVKTGTNFEGFTGYDDKSSKSRS